jgi:hypothetical protein
MSKLLFTLWFKRKVVNNVILHYVNPQELQSDALVEQNPEYNPFTTFSINEILLEGHVALGLYNLRKCEKFYGLCSIESCKMITDVEKNT